MSGTDLCWVGYFKVFSFDSPDGLYPFLLHFFFFRKLEVEHFRPILFAIAFSDAFWNTAVCTHSFLFWNVYSKRWLTPIEYYCLHTIAKTWPKTTKPALCLRLRGLSALVSMQNRYQSRAPLAIMKSCICSLFSHYLFQLILFIDILRNEYKGLPVQLGRGGLGFTWPRDDVTCGSGTD